MTIVWKAFPFYSLLLFTRTFDNVDVRCTRRSLMLLTASTLPRAQRCKLDHLEPALPGLSTGVTFIPRIPLELNPSTPKYWDINYLYR